MGDPNNMGQSAGGMAPPVKPGMGGGQKPPWQPGGGMDAAPNNRFGPRPLPNQAARDSWGNRSREYFSLGDYFGGGGRGGDDRYGGGVPEYMADPYGFGGGGGGWDESWFGDPEGSGGGYGGGSGGFGGGFPGNFGGPVMPQFRNGGRGRDPYAEYLDFQQRYPDGIDPGFNIDGPGQRSSTMSRQDYLQWLQDTQSGMYDHLYPDPYTGQRGGGGGGPYGTTFNEPVRRGRYQHYTGSGSVYYSDTPPDPNYYPR